MRKKTQKSIGPKKVLGGKYKSRYLFSFKIWGRQKWGRKTRMKPRVSSKRKAQESFGVEGWGTGKGKTSGRASENLEKNRVGEKPQADTDPCLLRGLKLSMAGQKSKTNRGVDTKGG